MVEKDKIYEIVIGAVENGGEYPAIENVFAARSICEKLYDDIYSTKERLSERLGKTGEEDADVERIINEMFDICSIVGKKMFDYGKLSVSK